MCRWTISPPGLQTLEVIWNPLAAEDEQPLDDRYSAASSGYTIRFLFNPSSELELDEETGRTFSPGNTTLDAEASPADDPDTEDSEQELTLRSWSDSAGSGG